MNTDEREPRTFTIAAIQRMNRDLRYYGGSSRIMAALWHCDRPGRMTAPPLPGNQPKAAVVDTLLGERR